MITGPIEPATPVVVAQIAIALARSRGGNTFTRIDNVDGMMNAAPTPITARQAMICVMSVAWDASRLARKNVASPNCSAPLRPKRSPSAPRREEQPREHERVRRHHPLELRLGGAEVAESVGRATLRVELPPNTMSRLRHSTASVHHRRA